MIRVKKGHFVAGYYKPGEIRTPFWRVDGWVFRGGDMNDWLHNITWHEPPKWWDLKGLYRWNKYMHMGYSKCFGSVYPTCNLCLEQVPKKIKLAIEEEVNKEK